MQILNLCQNGFKRIESLLSSPYRAITVQRMVHCQTRAQSEINAKSKGQNAEVLDDSTFQKRVDSLWKVGGIVSVGGGVEDTVTNAVRIGANSFAFFLKSPLQWKIPSLTPQSISEFKERMKEDGYTNNMVLPTNRKYLFHLDNPDSKMQEKCYEFFLDELQMCEALGLELYNLRSGPTYEKTTTSTEKFINMIAENINRAHKATRTVTIVLKNMTQQRGRNILLFSDLAGIIAKVEDKKRVGVCLDTCSTFAAGYDIRTKEGWDAMMSEFDKDIGLKYLRGMYLKDSKTACNSKEDPPQNIGLGCLGITAFQHILQDSRTQNIPLIVATPRFKAQKKILGMEIGVLQALTSTPPAKSEDLQSLVHEITSAVEEAKSTNRRLGVKEDGDSTNPNWQTWIERTIDNNPYHFRNSTIL